MMITHEKQSQHGTNTSSQGIPVNQSATSQHKRPLDGMESRMVGWTAGTVYTRREDLIPGEIG
jgi:hypothetical protein